MRPRLALALAVFALLQSSAARSADREPPGSELWVFGGAQGGFSDLGAVSGAELAKGGWNVGFKVVASKYTPDWVLDVGLGWFHDQQSASNPNESVRVKTNAGFIDLCPRYRINSHWQIGPSIPILFGPDVGLSEGSTGPSLAIWGGVRVEYEFLLPNNIFRVGAQGVTDVSVGDRQVSWIQLDLQFGFPTASKDAPEPVRAPEPAPDPVVNLPIPPIEAKEEPVIFPAKVTAPTEIAVTLNDVYFHFDTNSAKLKKPAVRRLKKLGFYLVKNNDAWATIKVDGHTDRRGTKAHNTKLSKSRAQSVMKELIKNGVEKNKIKATGYGPTRPVDPAKNHVAYAKNRRVEVVLQGVTDTARLAKEINGLSE